MRALFEQFVTVAPWGALMADFSGRADDQTAQVVLRPDIVWNVGGSAIAIVDAKYKAEKPAGYPNADLYQLLAY